jgi:membrane fusion protein (multidrug efflux system)
VDAARAAHTLAKADYERGRAMLKTRVIPTATLESTAARLQTAAAELERAQLNLARCEITAPMDAVVRRLDAKVGLHLAVGDPVGELLHIDRVKAVVGIPESDVDAVRRLDQVALTIQALGDRPLVGRKHFLAPSPDSSAYLYRLELALDNPGHDILPGMFFRARIVKKSIPDGLAVPLYSVISRGDEQYVFIAEGDTVRRRPVRLGVIEGWLVQVVEGLAPGDRVLVEGHREVEEGQGIRVIRTLTDPGQGTP